MVATTPCASKALYKSLQHCAGKTVLSGIRQRVYYIPKSDIVTWPVLPDTATDAMGKLATYEGNFVLASDKKWQFIDLVLNKGQIESETQGEKPSRSFLNKATLTNPAASADAAGFARQAVAEDLVYLIQQRDGQFRVLGNEMFETDTKPGFSTGEGATGEAGTTIAIEVTDLCPAPFYPGEIVTEAGKISGATGKPVV